jgi:hypothetical protein
VPLEGSEHVLKLHGSDTSRQYPHEQSFGAMRKPVGPSEAAMALIFDTNGSTMTPRWSGLAVGVSLVRFGVSKAALVALEHDARTLRMQP